MADVARTVVRPEYSAFAKNLIAVLDSSFELATRNRPVIAVGGESGSGKSTTAATLSRELTASGRLSMVLHQDDYFRLPPRANHAHRELTVAHVGPHEVDLDRMSSVIRAFRAGDAVDVPEVDYDADAFRVRRADFSNTQILVVEGTYVLTLDAVDLRIFLEATWLDTRERRRARSRDVDSPFVDQVLEIEHRLIAPLAGVADVLVDTEFRIRKR